MSPGGTTSPSSDADDLEDEREFLFRSIEDLDREHESGDLDDDDYRSLRDDYTARAAAVIRRIEQHTTEPTGADAGTTDPSRRRGSAILVVAAALAVVVVVTGVLLVRAADRRGAGDTATGAVPSSTESLLIDADECMAEEDVECALDAYDEVLVLDPDNVDALAYQGALYFREGDAELALEQIGRAIELDRTFVDAWSFEVLILEELGRTDEVLADIEQLVTDGDDDIALGIAQQLFTEQQLLAAIKVYDAILAVEPDHAPALAWRGWSMAMADLDEEALGYLDRSVAADPGLPEAQAFRAIVLNRLGRTEEAAAALEAFDATDPPAEMTAIVDGSGLREELGVPSQGGS